MIHSEVIFRLKCETDVNIFFRCPAWCDRILMSKAGKELMNGTDNYQYGIIGADTCMGDHKVTFLFQFINFF